jgi:hypothetical protein
MQYQPTVLVVGGTGRTGRRVLEQLLDRGAAVRAIVRPGSAARLPPHVAAHPGLTVIEADLLALDDAGLVDAVRGCDAVVSCLGHVTDLRGIYGAPRDLVTRAVIRLCGAIEACRPARPVKFILLSSVSVNHPEGLDTRRGLLEKVVLTAIRFGVPPARDNQRAADFLGSRGTDDRYVGWVAVRPDTLREGDACDYSLSETLVSSLFRPDSTNMATVAGFMCDLATDTAGWSAWRGKLPVIVNAAGA